MFKACCCCFSKKKKANDFSTEELKNKLIGKVEELNKTIDHYDKYIRGLHGHIQKICKTFELNQRQQTVLLRLCDDIDRSMQNCKPLTTQDINAKVKQSFQLDVLTHKKIVMLLWHCAQRQWYFNKQEESQHEIKSMEAQIKIMEALNREQAPLMQASPSEKWGDYYAFHDDSIDGNTLAIEEKKDSQRDRGISMQVDLYS